MSSDTPSGAARRFDFALLAALLLTALALWLRLGDITAQSLWWDEVSSWQQARLDLGGLIAATAADNYPPLHNLLLHVTMLALGDGPFALRLPSAVLGGLSVLALCWTGSPIASRTAALVAAALLCVSGFHIWYSEEARPYALLTCASIVYAGAALRCTLRPGWTWGIASVLAGAMLLYSHPYGALTWASIALALLLIALRQRGWRAALHFTAVQAIALLLFLPWALVLLGRARAVGTAGFWIPPVTPFRLYLYTAQVMTGLFMLIALILGTILAILPQAFPRRARALAFIDGPPPLLNRGSALLLLALWGVLPLVIGVVASALTEPVLIPRYLIGSLPALLLLIGMGVARLPRNLLGALGLAVIAFAGWSGLVGFGPEDRDDFRDIATALRADLKPGDCVVMGPESAIAMTYYYREGLPCSVVTPQIGEARFGTPPTRIWVIRSTRDKFADKSDLAQLGTLAGQNDFGVSRLLLLTPK